MIELEDMANKLSELLSSQSFLKRLLSAIIIVPAMILPLIMGGTSLIIIYLVFLTFVVNEIFDIIDNSNKKIFGFIYLFIAIFSIIFFIILSINIHNREFFVLVIVTIWLFDTLSYLGGSIFKGKKIFPKISKGKTYSGFFTGFFGVISLYLLSADYINSFQFISYYSVLMVVILAFIGDTIVSLLKRSASIKDSGSAIPGHGGFLDRLDSFIFVFFIVNIYFLIIL